MNEMEASKTQYFRGFENVIANQIRPCFIDGKRGKLLYLGYDIADLAE